MRLKNKVVMSIVSFVLVLAMMVGLVTPGIVQAASSLTTETLSATDVKTDCATLRGKVTANGGYKVANYGFMIKIDGEWISDGWASGHIDSGEVHEYEITGLEPGTKYEYYFVANSENPGMAAGYGGHVTFTTDCDHDYSEKVIDIEYGYDDGDDEYHWYSEKIQYTCEYCEDSYTEWTDEEYEPHNFNSKNKCIDCGYVLEDVIYATVSGFKLNPSSVEEGEEISLSGIISGNGEKIKVVQISVFEKDNHKKGGKHYRCTVNKSTYDLSDVPPIETGTTYSVGTTEELYMGVGKYDICIYVTLANGKGFEEDAIPTRVATVTEKEDEEIYASITGFEINPTTVEEGETISLSGTISGNGEKIEVVQVSVFENGNHDKGGVHYRYTLDKTTFNLSEIPPVETGKVYSPGTTEELYMGEGKYDICVYVRLENGNGFETMPMKTVTVTKKVRPSITDFEVNPSTVKEGEKIAVSGIVSGNGVNIEKVQVSIFVNGNHGKGDIHKNVTVNAESYDLSNMPLIETGKLYAAGTDKEFYMGEGQYDICVYVTLENGMGFEPSNIPTRVVTVTAAASLLGDVNADGSVTNMDRFVLNRYLEGMSGYTINKKNADIDGDGSVTENDCEILTRHLAKWTGYGDLKWFATGDVVGTAPGNENCPEHTPVGGQTVYSHHVYEDIISDNESHRVSAIIWNCICGKCGEAFTYESKEGYPGDELPRTESHIYDQYGVCVICLHKCTHNYVPTDKVVRYTGVWEDCGDGNHVRTSVMYVYRCTSCKSETQKKVNEPSVPEPHVLRYEDQKMAVDQLSRDDEQYYYKHQVIVDRWVYCSARVQGCDYSNHLGTMTILENHNYVDDLCCCGFSANEIPISIIGANGEELYLKWDHDSMIESVTNEGLRIYTSESGKYCGIALYNEKGEGVTGSSDDGIYQFVFTPYGSGCIDGDRVFNSKNQMNLNNGNNYVARRIDNYTFHCKESGVFNICIYENGHYRGEIRIEVINEDSKLLYGNSFYEKGDYGYGKVVQAPDTILELDNTDPDELKKKRLWFELNIPLGELKLVENMPTYEFEFIDEEKNTLRGFWQLVCMSGVRKGTVVVANLPKEIMKATAPNSIEIINLMEESDENRQMARIIATYLEEFDFNSLAERTPDITSAKLQNILDTKVGPTTLTGLLDGIKKWVPVKDIPDTVTAVLDAYADNSSVFESLTDTKGYISTLIGASIGQFCTDMELAIKMVKANILLDEIQKGIRGLDGISEKMKNEVIRVLRDDSFVIEERFISITDTMADVRGSIALGLCPQVAAVHWVLSVGSSLLGYESFESALGDLLEYNEKYEENKEKLKNALLIFKTDPTKYDQVVTAIDEYKDTVSVCIQLYEMLRVAEANSTIKQLFTEEQGYIDAAKNTTLYSKKRLLNYLDFLNNGALGQ